MKHASEAGFGIDREEQLNKEIEALREQNSALHAALEQAEATRKQQVSELAKKLAYYEEQIRLANQRAYGKSSEQSVPEQINLFNEAESEANPALPEPTEEQLVTPTTRKKSAVSRESMREDLPITIVEHRLPEEQQICECCGGPLHEIGCESRRSIEYIPAHIEITQHNTFRYGCRDCEQNGISSKIIEASTPKEIGRASCRERV